MNMLRAVGNATRQLALAVSVASIIVFAVVPRLSFAQTSRVQIIHNAPDPVLQRLDFYVGDRLVANDIELWAATPFLEVQSDTGAVISIAPSNSTGNGDNLVSASFNLQPNKDYVVVSVGVLTPGFFAPNPEGLDTQLALVVREAKRAAGSPLASEVLFINATPDAPELSFRRRGSQTPFASGVSYRETVGYEVVNQFVYTMDVTPTGADARLLGFFNLNLGFLQGQAFTLLTSGFENKWLNNDGPPFRLLVVTRDGSKFLISPESISPTTAQMQIINNSPDVLVPYGLDIRFDGGTAVHNLPFRRATKTFAVPGNRTLNIEVTDDSASSIFASTTLTVDNRGSYIVIINGLTDPSRYLANPNGLPTGLSISIVQDARFVSSQPLVGEYLFIHGIPDAPAVDLSVTGSTPVEGLAYNRVTPYLEQPVFDVIIEMFATGLNLPSLVSLPLNIPFVQGRTYTLFASGFLNPAQNNNGRPIALMLALDDGAVVDLAQRQLGFGQSRVQIVHASPDPNLDVVDLYVDDQLRLDNMLFKSGTGFFPVPATKTVTIGLAPPNSVSAANSFTSVRLNLEADVSHQIILNGILNPLLYAPNPDGKSTAFGAHVIEDVLESAPDPSRLTIRVAAEMTDAPASDVVIDLWGPIADSVSYGDVGPYIGVPAREHLIDYKLDSNPIRRYGRSTLNLTGAEGRLGTLVSTGFVDTLANQQGQGFSTFVVFTDGSTIDSNKNFTDAENDALDLPVEFSVSSNYPNPFSDATTLSYSIPSQANVTFEVFDPMGRSVYRTSSETSGGDHSINFDGRSLPSGVYLYKLSARMADGHRSSTGRMTVVR